MQGRMGDAARLEHIFDAVNEIEGYTQTTNFQDFSQNSMMIFACIKQLEIIGEASNHLSEELKQKYDSVEWRQIVGMRNVFVHEYFGVDIHLVWDVIQSDLPHFKHTIELMLEEIKQ